MRNKLYTEITTYGKNFSEEEIIDFVFKAIENGIGGINVSPNYISKLSSLLPDTINLSCPIDYPFGLSTTKVRQHQAISLIRKGCNTIDLVINPIHLVNNKKDVLLKDIDTIKKICKENEVVLRAMLEYRQFNEEVYRETIDLCRQKQIEYLFPSTGYFADDHIDNLIVSKMINSQYKDGKVITNGNVWKKEHYDLIEESGIYGLRLRAGYDISSIL